VHINYRLKIEVAITLCWQLCSTRYQPVQIKKYLKSNCVIKVASMKNTEKFPSQRGSYHQWLSGDGNNKHTHFKMKYNKLLMVL